MKPWGMTSTFQIVRPSRTQDAIYDAVKQAIDSGMSAQEFIAETKDCWAICLREKQDSDNKAFAKQK